MFEQWGLHCVRSGVPAQWYQLHQMCGLLLVLLIDWNLPGVHAYNLYNWHWHLLCLLFPLRHLRYCCHHLPVLCARLLLHLSIQFMREVCWLSPV